LLEFPDFADGDIAAGNIRIACNVGEGSFMHKDMNAMLVA